MKLLILSLLLLSTLAIKDDPKRWKSQTGESGAEGVADQKQYWFDQVLDHYDYQSTTLWKQRYWVVDKYFNPNDSFFFYFFF